MPAISRRTFLRIGAGVGIGLKSPITPLRALPSGRRKMVRVAQVQGDSSDIVMVSRSPEMQRLMDLVRTISKVDSPVLITGESGTGKERIARFVHEHSARVDGPFIAMNCAAISESLLESELFGTSRDAIAGAIADRPGLFETAGRGTLFLNEVDEIPLAMQVKLLRAVEERQVRRGGENQSRPINVRIITATNKNLLPELAAKRLRDDLFYGLNGVKLSVPPLRKRKEDVLPLARIFLAEASARMKRPIEGFSDPVVDHLLGYPWPGNVRELSNMMERAVAMAQVNRIDAKDLPPEVR